MAYLPPELAETAAGAIGRPIPGGSLRIDGGDLAAGDVGELVYSGPNVMLGYAEHPADFALGRTVDELRTGDLARRRDDGLLEIVGRASRFVKVFGLRIDLDHVERLLDEAGVPARVVGHDERMVVFVLADRARAQAVRMVAEASRLPQHAFDVHALAEFPRTASGKPDYAVLRDHARLLAASATAGAQGSSTPAATDVAGSLGPAHASLDGVRALYAELLGRPDADVDDSFATLEGDSLNYVELSLRLEELLGELPGDWPGRSIRSLVAAAAPQHQSVEAPPPAQPDPVTATPTAETVAAPRADRGAARPPVRAWRRVARVETSVVLRTVAIVLIVATHADLVALKGGAHLLLAVAGFNLARFKLTDVPRPTRLRGLLRGARHLVVPAVLWIGGVALVVGTYDPATALLANNLAGDFSAWNEQWQFWFLEALVWAIAALALLLVVPGVDALERRHRFGFPLAVLGATLVVRYAVAGGAFADSPERYAAPVVAWLVALGWLVARADTTSRRWLVTGLIALTVPGFFGDPVREGIVAVGLLVLVWARSLPVPALLTGALGAIASASMFVYLTHWQVYPPIEEVSPALAVVASFAVGLAVWRLYGIASRALSGAATRIAARVRSPKRA